MSSQFLFYNDLMDERYSQNFNRVVDYIEAHIGDDMTLDQLASVACFSPFHFHRIFSAIQGETLFQYIQRLRLEKAATILLTFPDKSITTIAIELGFSGSDVFARLFKRQYNQTASEWRKKGSLNQYSNEGQRLRKDDQERLIWNFYLESINNSMFWRTRMNEKNYVVEVTEMPAMTLAYVRHEGPYAGDAELFSRLYQELFSWAGPKGLMNGTEYSYVIYHDNPEITDEAKLRTSVCLPVQEETEVGGKIGILKTQSGLYAKAAFSLTPAEYGEAWNWVYGVWLPESGYLPSDGVCFEEYPMEEEKDGKMNVKICVPLQPK